MARNTISDHILYRLSEREMHSKLERLYGIQKDPFLESETPKVELRFGKYNDIISKFIEIFHKNFTPEQIKAMEYRLSQLEIKEEWRKWNRKSYPDRYPRR